MFADKMYELFTNAKKDRKLPIGELILRRHDAFEGHKSAIETQATATSSLSRLISGITASLCELKYGYYNGIIHQHPDQAHIMSGEFGDTVAEINEALGIETGRE